MADQVNRSGTASPAIKKRRTAAPLNILNMAANLIMAQAPAGPSTGKIRNNLLHKTLTKNHSDRNAADVSDRQLRPRNNKRVEDDLSATTLAMILDNEEQEAKRVKRHLRQAEDIADYTSYSNQLLRIN